MKISQATLSDLDDLLDLESELFGRDEFALSGANFRYHLKKDHILKAYDGSVLMGYLLFLRRRGSSKIRIYSLGVAKKFWRSGVAQKLLDHLVDLRAKSITLEVNEANLKGIAFYTKNGFYPTKILPLYYPDGANAIKMQKDLVK